MLTMIFNNQLLELNLKEFSMREIKIYDQFDSYSHAEKEGLLTDIQKELLRALKNTKNKKVYSNQCHFSRHVNNHIDLIEKIKSSNNLDFLLDENLYMRLRIMAETNL